MESPFKKKEPTPLDAITDDLYSNLERTDPDSEKYPTYLTYLERLTALKGEKPERFSKNTLLTVGGQLLGILVIVAYEQKHVFTSKGLGFIMKVKP